MGREVKRVALDFDWPLRKTWNGFLNPHYRQCSVCEGSGHTTAYLRLEELASLLFVSADDTVRKRGTIPHPYLSEMSSLYRTRGLVVSPDIMQLAEGLSDQKHADSFMGFSGGASWRATKKIIAAAGLDEKWGECPACGGEGEDLSAKPASDAWEETEPPAGDGWQMWETTSEGSPISPVCKTPEALARWLADNKASTFGDSTANYETWLKMIISTGWAMSAVMDADGLRSGVDHIAETANEPKN